MTNFIALHCQADSPELLVRRAWQQHGGAHTTTPFVAAVTFFLEQYWLAHQPVISLTGIYHCELVEGQEQWSVSVTEEPDAIVRALSNVDGRLSGNEFAAILEQCGLPCFRVDLPLPLQVVTIPKPWGQEIWYTGIEERGVAIAGGPEGQVPLPWLLAVMPEGFCSNRHRELVLLKILDPLPEPVFGDLYFELHQEKREVYVVTAIDDQAWPDGVGAIRYGFNPARVLDYPDEQAFKQAYLEAVKTYEAARRRIDGLIDELRQRDSIALDAPVDATTLKQWLDELPSELRAEEQRLRAVMEGFTHTRPLQLGDVVKVPTLTPHSLQHGVRTIEFQTPVYERLIVSFAQKVVTQSHWDTEQAVSLMDLQAPEQPDNERVFDEHGVLVERIVDFEDFDVLRVRMRSGGQFALPGNEDYRLVISICGHLSIAGQPCAPEQAMLIPPSCLSEPLCNLGQGELIFLVARPK